MCGFLVAEDKGLGERWVATFGVIVIARRVRLEGEIKIDNFLCFIELGKRGKTGIAWIFNSWRRFATGWCAVANFTLNIWGRWEMFAIQDSDTGIEIGVLWGVLDASLDSGPIARFCDVSRGVRIVHGCP